MSTIPSQGGSGSSACWPRYAHSPLRSAGAPQAPRHPRMRRYFVGARPPARATAFISRAGSARAYADTPLRSVSAPRKFHPTLRYPRPPPLATGLAWACAARLAPSPLARRRSVAATRLRPRPASAALRGPVAPSLRYRCATALAFPRVLARQAIVRSLSAGQPGGNTPRGRLRKPSAALRVYRRRPSPHRSPPRSCRTGVLLPLRSSRLTMFA